LGGIGSAGASVYQYGNFEGGETPFITKKRQKQTVGGKKNKRGQFPKRASQEARKKVPMLKREQAETRPGRLEIFLLKRNQVKKSRGGGNLLREVGNFGGRGKEGRGMAPIKKKKKRGPKRTKKRSRHFIAGEKGISNAYTKKKKRSKRKGGGGEPREKGQGKASELLGKGVLARGEMGPCCGAQKGGGARKGKETNPRRVWQKGTLRPKKGKPNEGNNNGGGDRL